jgi:serine/threonine-protein kinase
MSSLVRQIGRYQVESEIGRGGMGVVYRAVDPLLGRTVAIKTIRLSKLAEPEERAELEKRLVREARSAGALGHPSIVTVYDLVQEEDLTCIVMEFVEGQTLGHMLETGQALDNSVVLSFLRQTGAALDYAHRKGIVHRDVKPSNLIVQPGGTVKIADFGVARVSTTLQLTRSGMVMGTPYYMSPEQIQGKPLDGRTDQFSLAVTAYEVLTGRKPFTGDTLTTLMYQIVHEDPLPAEKLNTTLGTQVGTVLRKAMSKDPEARYATCGEFLGALEGACSAATAWRAPTMAVPVMAPVVTPAATRPAAAPRRWVLAVAGAVLIVVLAAGGYFAFRQSPVKEEPVPIEPAQEQTIPAPAAQPGSVAEVPAPTAARNPPPEPSPPPMTAPTPVLRPKAAIERGRAPKPPATSPPKQTRIAKAEQATPPAPIEESDKGQASRPVAISTGKQTPTAEAAQAVQPAPMAPQAPYLGPQKGRLVWTGELEPNSRLEINGMKCSTGSLTGSELPGVRVRARSMSPGAKLIQEPVPENQWKGLVLVSGDTKQVRIIISWEVIP